MKLKISIFLLCVIAISACQKQEVTIDDRSFIDNENSILLPLLMKREDFPSDLIIRYGQVKQTYNTDWVFPSKEYASYSVLAKAKSDQTLFLISHGLYRVDIFPLEEIDRILFDENSTFKNIEDVTIPEITEINAKCADYADAGFDKQVCRCVIVYEQTVSILTIRAPLNLSKERMIEILSTMTLALDKRLSK